MWAWRKPNKHLMFGYTCKGDSFENVTGLGLGQTVYVFGTGVVFFCSLFVFSYVFFSATVILCTQLMLDDY